MYFCNIHVYALFFFLCPSSDDGKGGPIGQYGVAMQYERSFKWKVGHFRTLCSVSTCTCTFTTCTYCIHVHVYVHVL